MPERVLLPVELEELEISLGDMIGLKKSLTNGASC